MKYFKKLVGERIYLSPRNSEDVEQFTEWLNDFNTTDYIGRSGASVTLDTEKEYLSRVSKDTATFVIVTLEDNKMIGTVSLEQIDDINRNATLGIFIGLILEYGFRYLNLHNIKLDLMEFNERALKCYKKCGFQENGRRRKCKFINGKYYDSISMDILAEEFTGDFIKNKNI